MTIDEIRNGLLQKLQQVGTQAQATFWNKNNPIANAALTLQKATPAYQQGGQQAFGKGYLYNNQGIQNYAPQIQAPKVNNPILQTVANFGVGLANLPIQAGANTFAPIVNLATDVGTNIGHKVLNQGATPYQHLKSPFARLEYNALGQNNNPREVVGNAAAAGLDILNMSTLKAGKAVTESAINTAVKDGFLTALKKGSLEGGTFMGSMGFLQGLSDNRSAKTALEQFQKGGEEGAKGFLLGAVTGGLLSGSGHLFGKIFIRTPKVEKQLRDSQGRWTTGEQPVKPKGMAQAAWDFQLKFNKEYKRNPYTPVYPEDVKAAVKFELEKKGAGMSIRDVTKDENPLQAGNTPQSQVPTGQENNISINAENPFQTNQRLSSEQILAKAEQDIKGELGNISRISSNESVPQVNSRMDMNKVEYPGQVQVNGAGKLQGNNSQITKGLQEQPKLPPSSLVDSSLKKAEPSLPPQSQEVGINPSERSIAQVPNSENPFQTNQRLSSEQILAKAEQDIKGATENISRISSSESVPQITNQGVVGAVPLEGQIPQQEPSLLGLKTESNIQQARTQQSQTQIKSTPDDSLPQIIPEGMKERQFVGTVRDSKTTAPDVAQKVEGYYSPTSSKETISKASYAVDANYDAAKQRVINEPLSADTNAIGQEIMRRAQNEGRYDEAIQMAETLAKKGTQAGQAVQAFSNWARLTPEGMLKYAQKEMLSAGEKLNIISKVFKNKFGSNQTKLTEEDAKIITNLMEKANKTSNEVERAKYIREIFEYIGKKLPWGVSDIVDEYRYNNMLSNPLTHLRNIWSNLIQTYVTRPGTLTAEGRTIEAAKYEYGAIKALPDAFKNAYKAFKEGSPLGKMDANGISKLQPIKPSRIGFLGAPSRALEGADQFFSTLIKGGEMANGKGADEAAKMAEYTLFRSDLKPEGQGYLLNGIDNVTRAVYGLRKVGLGWFIPFLKTPMNVAKQWIEYSPTGLLTVPGAANKRSQLAKAALGSIVTAIGASLAMEGRTTWAAPTDPKQKQLFYDSGRKPYSIKIGDKWVPMQTAGVFAYALGIPAAVKYYQDESRTALTDSQIEKLTKVAAAGLGFWSQQTFVSGLGSFVKLAEGDTDYTLPKNIAFTLGQLKPWEGLMRYVATAIDPVFRKPKGFAQQMVSDIPVISKGLPAYEDSLGNSSKRNLSNYVAPYGMGQDNPTFEEPYQLRTQQLQQNAVLNKMKNDLLNKSNGIDQASAAELSPQNDLQAQFEEDMAKQKIKIQGGVTNIGNKYFYNEKGDVKTLDINPPTKGNGIDAFVNTDWNITKARDVWNSNLPQNTKDEIFKKLGVDPKDVRYDALANHNADVSTQYIKSKSADHVALLKNIITGRQVSISGTQFASNSVIDNLVDEGLLSKEEAKQLKALKYDSKGNNLNVSTPKAKKGKKLALKKATGSFKIPTKQSQAKTIKSGKPTKIKTPNVSFDTQFSKKGSIPQSPKYRVKFQL